MISSHTHNTCFLYIFFLYITFTFSHYGFLQIQCHYVFLTALNSLSYVASLVAQMVKNLLPQVALVVKNPLASAGDVRDVGSIPGLGRCLEGGHGNPFQ